MRSPILTCLDSLDINNLKSIMTFLLQITHYLDRVILIEESLFPKLYKGHDSLSKQFNAALSSLTSMHEGKVTDHHLHKLRQLLLSPLLKPRNLSQAYFEMMNVTAILIKKFEIDNPQQTIELNLDNPKESFQKTSLQEPQEKQIQEIKNEVSYKRQFYYHLRLSYLLNQSLQQVKKDSTPGYVYSTDLHLNSSLQASNLLKLKSPPARPPLSTGHLNDRHFPHFDHLKQQAQKLIGHCKRRGCHPDAWEVRATQAILLLLEQMEQQSDNSNLTKSAVKKIIKLIEIVEQRFSVHRNNLITRSLQMMFFSCRQAMPIFNLFFSLGLMTYQCKKSGGVTDHTPFLLFTNEPRSTLFAQDFKKKVQKQQNLPPSLVIALTAIPKESKQPSP